LLVGLEDKAGWDELLPIRRGSCVYAAKKGNRSGATGVFVTQVCTTLLWTLFASGCEIDNLDRVRSRGRVRRGSCVPPLMTGREAPYVLPAPTPPGSLLLLTWSRKACAERDSHHPHIGYRTYAPFLCSLLTLCSGKVLNLLLRGIPMVLHAGDCALMGGSKVRKSSIRQKMAYPPSIKDLCHSAQGR
jgi:hypothetical protein